MKKGKRIVAIILCLAVTLSLCNLAFAQENDSSENAAREIAAEQQTGTVEIVSPENEAPVSAEGSSQASIAESIDKAEVTFMPEETTGSQGTDPLGGGAHQRIIKDENTKICANLSDSVLPENVSLEQVALSVKKLTPEEQSEIFGEEYALYDIAGYDISLVNTATGENIQPNGNVEVSMPVPENFGENMFVLHKKDGDINQIDLSLIHI